MKDGENTMARNRYNNEENFALNPTLEELLAIMNGFRRRMHRSTRRQRICVERTRRLRGR